MLKSSLDTAKDILGEGFGNRILDYMEQLGRGMGVAAEHVYTELVRYQVALGIAYMACALLIIIGSIWFIRWLWKQGIEVEIVILPVIALGALVIGMLILFFNGFMHVFSPEYYAMKDIVDAVKDMTGNARK